MTMFASQLEQVIRLRPAMVERYGIDPDQLAAIQARLTSWMSELRGQGQATTDLTKPPSSLTRNVGRDTTMNHSCDTEMRR